MATHLQAAADLTIQHRLVHGHDRAFVIAGSGPALVLLHGVGSNLRTWDRVIERLARDHTVIAPDLLGHGESAKPRADYSVGGYANGVRDLLSIHDIERVTVVGHSLGGGVAMQFAYQFPERCERLILIAPGGLGRQVTPLLRFLTVPGSGPLLAVAEAPPVRAAAGAMTRLLSAVRGVKSLGLDIDELATLMSDLSTAEARWAFQHMLRTVIGPSGQIITMLDRCYLAQSLPVLLVWGDRDRVLPVRHARVGAAAIPGARLEIFEGCGHFPHREDPARFVTIVRDFLATTVPSRYDVAGWRELLRSGAALPALEEAYAPRS